MKEFARGVKMAQDDTGDFIKNRQSLVKDLDLSVSGYSGCFLYEQPAVLEAASSVP